MSRLWYVDSGYSGGRETKMEVKIDELNIERGQFVFSSVMKDLDSVWDGASNLATFVAQENPDQIIFNKLGVSLALFETFKEELGRHNLQLNENGALTTV
jgi:hypothetical protein